VPWSSSRGNESSPQLFPVLRGFASFYNYRAEFDKVARVGREIPHLADVQAIRPEVRCQDAAAMSRDRAVPLAAAAG
jgi:hypothetical protein